jgi:uncharacterized protein (TIGR03545 family)
VAFVGIVSAILLLFLDIWIRLAAVSSLEKITGAEVNIASVSHRLSPFGVTLQKVQLTDPSRPTHNQVQADEIIAQIDLAPLLLNKIIIDDMTITGVAFSQIRESEGDVYRLPEGQDSKPKILDPKNIPSVDDILARADLKTTKAIKEAQESYQRHAQTLKSQYENLPSKEKLNQYKVKIKALTQTNYKNPLELAAAKKEFDKLRTDLSEDKQKIESFKQAVSEARQDLAPKIANLKAAPGQDYDQFKLLIAGDQGAIEDVTRMILGDKAAVWSDYLLSVYQIAAPLMSGSKEHAQIRDHGRWIAFSDAAKLPDIWIKKADISLKWQQEDIRSSWQNITHQHAIIGMPTTFKIDSAASALWQSLQVNGDFKLSDLGFDANQKWDLKGIKLNDITLLQEQKLTTKIEQAIMASTGSLAVTNGVMSGAGNIDFSQLVMSAVGQNNLTKVIAETLSKLKSLKIKTDISGSYKKPKVSFTSDLDRQLGAALLANLSGDQQTKLGELKNKLSAKTQGILGEKNSQLTQWLDWQKLAEGNLGSVEDMLATQFNKTLDQEKDKIKDKLKNKLADKLFGK